MKPVFVALLLAALLGMSLRVSPAATPGDIVGHVIAGYQGWFSTPGDGSPVGNLPVGTGNYHSNFESYPDMREFPDSERFSDPRSAGVLPDAGKATVFASDRDFTTDLHARWMKQYGIDVAAIQRFGEVATDTRYRDQKNDVTRRMRRACEKHGVKFYIEYDTSGSASGGWGPDFARGIEKDWTDFAAGEHMIGSPAYARQNGKAVVELWGMGLNDNNIVSSPAPWLALVRWFKERGVYVIGGTPTRWRTGERDALPGFDSVYAACDAINPWIVGRFSNVAGADDYARTFLAPDLAWCRKKQIDYIPCVYPGTAFFNTNGKSKNAVPRRGGELLWRQFVNLRRAGIATCFVSMFDEFNEATAIAKSAEDASMIPAGSYFLTSDADGTPVSSDFYLRLTHDGGRMLRSQTPLQPTVPTPARNDLFTTSCEEGQPVPIGGATPCTSEQARRGSRSLRCVVPDTHGNESVLSVPLFEFADHPLPIGVDTILSYWIRPQTDAGRYVAIDLHFTDGTTLAQTACVDQNGKSLRAGDGHGGTLALGAWRVVTSNLGALAGKKIDRISVVFARRGETEAPVAFIDDLQLSR